jgi:Protein of unknown function (DUF4012)
MTVERQRSGLDDLFEDIETARRDRTPRWRRWVRRGLLVLFGLLVLAGLLSIPPAIGAASKLLDARADLLIGREALVSGEVGEAERAFGRARDSFSGARGDMGNPAIRVMSWLPLLGRTPDAVTAVAEAGELVARSGLELARSGEGLPGQIASLAPRNGRIPLAPMSRLAPALDRAAGLLGRADAIMRESPDRWIPGPVGDPRYEFETELAEAHRIVRAAAGLARALPVFLGEDGTKRYLVGAQNPAELRGTGGFMGAVAIMEARQGRIRLGHFGPINEITPSRIQGVDPPNRDYARIYDPWGGAELMHNINMTPDVPSAAMAIERLYERVEGVRLDGVVLADPHALASLMRVTGGARVPGLGVTLDAETLVPFVSNEAFAILRDADARKRLLGDVAGGILQRFLSGSATSDPTEMGRALLEAAGDGHLLLHSRDPSIQSVFEEARIAGSLVRPPGDYLNVVVNNLGANKVDYFVNRAVTYDVELRPGGEAEATATVRFDNQAPTRGQPVYVIGPHPGASGIGEDVVLTSVYCAPGCDVRDFRRNGRPQPLSLEEELGHPLVRSVSRIASDETERLAHRWHLSAAWEGAAGYGSYQLTFQGQPTIRPTHLEVTIRAPEGMRITRTDPEMEIEGGIARWRGKPGDLAMFRVDFASSLPSRLWGAVWDFLDQPLLGVVRGRIGDVRTTS